MARRNGAFRFGRKAYHEVFQKESEVSHCPFVSISRILASETDWVEKETRLSQSNWQGRI